MKKLVFLFIICLLSMMMVSCKSKQKVVETVQYVHDTTFFNKDSVVYRYLTFNGTDEEKTATWTSHGNTTDTVWKYRIRTVKSNAGESVKAETHGNQVRVKKDSTANTAKKAYYNEGVSKKEKKGGVQSWLGWLLFVVLLLIDISFFVLCKRGKIVFKVNK